MAKQTINLGTGNDTGDGEGLRLGGVKIEANFTELYGVTYVTIADATSILPNSVRLSLQTINVSQLAGVVPITSGGTGQSNQQSAINALTNVAAATNEHVLTKDTSTGHAIFKAAAAGGGTPGGATQEIQYNSAGSFGGIPRVKWDGTRIIVDARTDAFVIGNTTAPANSRYFRWEVNASGNGQIRAVDDAFASPLTVFSWGRTGDFTIAGDLSVVSVDVTNTLTVIGNVDFSVASSMAIPFSAAPTVDANGEMALDTTVTNWSHGIIRYFGGQELALVALPVAQLTTPLNGQVPTYNATTDSFELAIPSGSGAPSDATYVTLSANGTLVNERILTGESGTITVSDGGPGAAVTVGIGTNVVTLTGSQSLTNKTLGTGTVFSVAPTINDGIKFTFNPSATVAGINVGTQASDPSTPVAGDIWYTTGGAGSFVARFGAFTATLAYGGGAFHDGFSDFVANEHIDHTTVSISAGAGLSGGGTIAANRTLQLADAAAWSVKCRNAGTTGALGDETSATLTTGTPASGDFLLGWESTGELRKFDVGALPGGGGSPGGADTHVQFNDAGAFGGDAEFTYNKTNGTVNLGGATITTNDPVLDLTQTWNAGGVTFQSVKLNVTDTASAAASSLIDLQVGGSSEFVVVKDGQVRNGKPYSAALPSYSFLNRTDTGLSNSDASLFLISAGAAHFSLGGNEAQFASGTALGWSSASTADQASNDTMLRRESAGRIGQRNGVNAQRLDIYNTFTSSTNYELAKLHWASNTLSIGTEKGSGGGTARDMVLVTDDVERMRITAAGVVTVNAPAWSLLLRNNGTTGDAAFTKISALTDRTGFGAGDKLMIEESTGELRKIDFNDLPGAGGGISNAYANMFDGTTTASAVSADTFKLRSSTKVTVTVGSNDPTHGDNALFDLGTVNLEDLANVADTPPGAANDILFHNGTAWRPGDETVLTDGGTAVNGVEFLAWTSAGDIRTFLWQNMFTSAVANLTGTKAQFDTACTDGNFFFAGDTLSAANLTGTKAQFDTACSDGNFVYSGDAITALTGTKAQFDTACSDGNFLYVGDIVAASTTVAGIVELATSAETDTGTDATRAITPDGLAGSNLGSKSLSILAIEFSTALTTGDGKFYCPFPAELAGMNLVSVGAQLGATGTTGTTIQLSRGRITGATTRAFAGMLVTNLLTIDANEFDSKDATTAATIDTANDDIQLGDILRVDVNAAGSGATGLMIRLGCRLP